MSYSKLTRGAVRSLRAFTIVEVVIAMTLILMLVLAVYGAISSGMTTVRMSRQNLRATQILLEKVEAIRLYNWDQLNPSYIPSTFVANYDVSATGTNTGVLYYGTVTLEPANTGTSYTDTMKLVTVRLNWMTGKITRSRELSTYVCQTGLQNYVY
jgi:type II secretory pathway pseudopilin PulG